MEAYKFFIEEKSFPTKVEEVIHIWSMEVVIYQNQKNLPSKNKKKIWKRGRGFASGNDFIFMVYLDFSSKQGQWGFLIYPSYHHALLGSFKHKESQFKWDKDQSF